MKLPINNRVMAQVMQNRESLGISLETITRSLAHSIGHEIMNNVVVKEDIKHLVSPTGEQDVYGLEVYVFTRQQLEDLLANKYGEGYNEGVDDGMNK